MQRLVLTQSPVSTAAEERHRAFTDLVARLNSGEKADHVLAAEELA